jgi:hypothetical protein
MVLSGQLNCLFNDCRTAYAWGCLGALLAEGERCIISASLFALQTVGVVSYFKVFEVLSVSILFNLGLLGLGRLRLVLFILILVVMGRYGDTTAHNRASNNY